MTDSPTSQAMHLAMTELKEREQRIAVLEEALRAIAKPGYGLELGDSAEVRADYWFRDAESSRTIARSVLHKESSSVKASDEAEFELHCNGDYEASACGPRAEAWAEIQHYAIQCQWDGPVVIYEVTRTPVQENDRA